jgi:hypothetical protein
MKQQQAIELASNGNEQAAAFLMLIVRISGVWDDLVDRDVPVPDEAINRVFWNCLISLPNNQFFAQNRAALESVLVTSIVNWRSATQAERSEETPQTWAYIARSSFIDLFLMTATLTGGPDHAVNIAKELRETFHHEGMEVYATELKRERLAREGKKPKEK